MSTRFLNASTQLFSSMAHSLELTVKRYETQFDPTFRANPIWTQVPLRYRWPTTSSISTSICAILSEERGDELKKDPVRVIKHAVAKALVYYYPFAGRLREGSNGKLTVECTGEGVLFIEANANVTLDHFADALVPPIPAMDELLYNVPGSSGILNCPLLVIQVIFFPYPFSTSLSIDTGLWSSFICTRQVTRLACGGFVVALRFNHTMCDGSGLVQFMNAIAEMARGASIPSVEPVWNRDLLIARAPPRA